MVEIKSSHDDTEFVTTEKPLLLQRDEQAKLGSAVLIFVRA